MYDFKSHQRCYIQMGLSGVLEVILFSKCQSIDFQKARTMVHLLPHSL